MGFYTVRVYNRRGRLTEVAEHVEASSPKEARYIILQEYEDYGYDPLDLQIEVTPENYTDIQTYD